MRETFDRMWTQIREWFARMPRGRRIQLIVLTVFVIVLAIVVVSLLTQTRWALLPGSSDPNATPHVYAALNEMGVQTRVEGNSIYVPEDRLGDVQMRLREQGLLGTADFNNDIMGGASGFGITDSHAKRLYDRQLGADIKTMLMQMPRIQNALIIANSGETSPFRVQTNARQASASVMLTLRGGGRLSNQEAQTIGEIVKDSIPGIDINNISISDSEFNLYRIGDASQDFDMIADTRIAFQNRLTAQFKEQIEQMLSPVFGISNLQVQPHVKLNFDRMVSEKVEFFPPIPGAEDGIIRSLEEIYENSRRLGDAEGIPGTDSNYMGTAEYPYGRLDDLDEYRRAVFSKNYEINETRTRIEHEEGVVEQLSISVLINSEIEGVDQDYTVELTDSISKAIGVSPGNISIQLIPFAFIDTSLEEMYQRWEEEEAARRSRELFDTILMYAVIVLLGVMVMLLVRSIVKAVKPPPEPEPELLLAAGPDGIDLIVGDDEAAEPEFEEVDLHAKSPGLEQIERFIDKDSASVAQLLRNWLSDE